MSIPTALAINRLCRPQHSRSAMEKAIFATRQELGLDAGAWKEEVFALTLQEVHILGVRVKPSLNGTRSSIEQISPDSRYF